MGQLAAAQSRNAQISNGPEGLSATKAFEKADGPNTSGPLARNAINIKAMRHFRQLFPQVQDEKWYPIKGGLMVKYLVDSLHIRTDYDVYGQWLYTIRYYGEAHLPADVRHIVRSNWYDYFITLIEEINLPGKEIVYVVHINYGDLWKQIRVQNGEASVLPTRGKG